MTETIVQQMTLKKQNFVSKDFYKNDVLKVAPQLLGKIIVLNKTAYPEYFIITETEAYRGEEDKACHCSKGRTTRTEVMYHSGGVYYVYLIYGMYWMLNIVTGKQDQPQAVLIRGIKQVDENGNTIRTINGPGRVTKTLGIDKQLYGKDVSDNDKLEIWNETKPIKPEQIETSTRVGIDYAGEEWINKPWRYILK